MFEFLKSLFKKEIEKKDVNVSELSEWFDAKTRSRSEEINEDIKGYIEEVRKILKSMGENLEKLKKAEIKEPDKIQEKVKNVVLGHRDGYCRTLAHFINNMEFPDHVNYIEGKRFSHDIDESLDEFGKNTIKSYKAVQYLFFDEVKPIKDDLKRLAGTAKKIRKDIEDKGISEIDKVKEDIDNFIKSIKKKENMGLKIKKEKNDLAEIKSEKADYENKLEELNNSGDYKRFEKYNEELTDVEDSIKHKENEIIQLFSSVEKGLRKFKRISIENEKIIGEYLDSCVEALLDDKEMKIINILNNMKRNIKSEGVDLRDKKKEKILEGIEAISAERLKKIVSEYKNLRDKKEDIKKNINSNPVKSQIKELEYKIEHISFKTKNKKEDIDSSEKNYDSIDIIELKDRLEKEIKKIIEIEVFIRL
ncbi:hypothetical protein GF361_05920 [Candidatus Woesearchaeota archaeon]|nr:hypothetical protein [Candidatus Woesearchaeota archaeon]